MIKINRNKNTDLNIYLAVNYKKQANNCSQLQKKYTIWYYFKLIFRIM